MDLGLKGKKAIVTGGSRGIGRKVVEILIAEGADVAFCSRNQADVDATTGAVSGNGKLIGKALDVADHAALAAWINDVGQTLGGVDIFVHGASSSGGDTTDWQQGLDIDVLGAVRACEALEPWLEKSDAASIVLMSSTAATETFFQPQAFNALKAALITYSKQLGQAWGPKGIRVNSVSPGPTYYVGGNWEKIEQGMKEFFDSIVATTALGKLGTAEEIAKTVVFLSSPASSHTSGTNVIVDGGFTKRVQY